MPEAARDDLVARREAILAIEAAANILTCPQLEGITV